MYTPAQLIISYILASFRSVINQTRINEHFFYLSRKVSPKRGKVYDVLHVQKYLVINLLEKTNNFIFFSFSEYILIQINGLIPYTIFMFMDYTLKF